LEEVAGVGRKRSTREFLEEFKGGGIDGIGEGRGPEAGIKVVGERGVGIEVGSKKVGGGKLGAFAEELGRFLGVTTLAIIVLGCHDTC
jgi:hypothetical protein